MLRITILAGVGVLAFSVIAVRPAPSAGAGIKDILDTLELEEFDDIAECGYTIKKMRLKVETRSGYRWVWIKKRVMECDD